MKPLNSLSTRLTIKGIATIAKIRGADLRKVSSYIATSRVSVA